MNPAVGSHAAGSPDDAAKVALKGASLAFQKRSTPYTATSSSSSSQHNLHAPTSQNALSSSLSAGRRPGARSSSRSASPPAPRLHNQQYSLDHYRDNGALLAATSSVERARSPGVAAGLSPSHSWHLHAHPGHHGQGHGHAVGHEVETETTVLPAGLVAARLQHLGVATAANAAVVGSASPIVIPASSARAPSTSPSSHLALGFSPQSPAGVGAALAKIDAKSPSLIAATLAASRSASPTPTTSRKPRRMRSVNTLQDVEAVDSEPIPPTNSLISMFEQDKPSTDALAQRRIPRSSPEQALPRKSARPTPISVKQTLVAPDPEQRRAASKLRGSRNQSRGRPPTPPQAAVPKTASAAPRRPPTPPAAVDRAPDSAPATPVRKPSVASKAIVQAAANKPRVTPPKAKQAKKADGSPNATLPVNLISRSKSTTAVKRTDIAADTRSHSHRHSQMSIDVARGSKNTQSACDLSPREPTTPRHKSPTPQVISRSTTEVLSPKPTRVTRAASLRSGTPPPSIVLRPTSDVQSPPSADPKKRQMGEKRPPTPPKPRSSNRLAPARSGNGRPRGNSDTPLSGTTPVNSMWGLPIVSTTANTPRLSKSPPPPPTRRESIVSAPSSPTHEPPRRRQSTQSSSNPMQLSSMTNAIMASSLASSRLTPHHTGSSLPPPSLPKRQRSPHLLQTLRQPQSEPEDEHDWPKKNHRHRLHSSKHTHHEGSRRRWRDKVSDKERKRYEALWASNRGLLLTYESPSTSIGSGIGTELSECVVNVVVRDIWKRSRLPVEELAEVWDLVDRNHRGYLTRQEFVVGMFLIDQRLRGRKLPPKVSDSIWGSVNGVTVLKPGPKHSKH